MIVFAESRQEVFEIYKMRFDECGESIIQLYGEDLLEWLRTVDRTELVSIEAVLVGETEDLANCVNAFRSRADVPVLAILDERNLPRLVNCYHCGVDDVVAKPVHFDELFVRIAAIKKRYMRSQVVASAGGDNADKDGDRAITLFFDGTDPQLAGNTIALPRRERRILEYLASINGRRATKVQIFNAIYGIFDEHIDECVVESHISKLRKKLRKVFGCDPIDSKRYLGYRLDPAFVSINRQNTIERLVA